MQRKRKVVLWDKLREEWETASAVFLSSTQTGSSTEIKTDLRAFVCNGGLKKHAGCQRKELKVNNDSDQLMHQFIIRQISSEMWGCCCWFFLGEMCTLKLQLHKQTVGFVSSCQTFYTFLLKRPHDGQMSAR